MTGVGPAAAAQVVKDVMSSNPDTVRNALVPELASLVTDRTTAPAGTRVAVQPRTWRQRSDIATVRVVITVPRRAAVTQVFYLEWEEGQWRVLFADAA